MLPEAEAAEHHPVSNPNSNCASQEIILQPKPISDRENNWKSGVGCLMTASIVVASYLLSKQNAF